MILPRQGWPEFVAETQHDDALCPLWLIADDIEDDVRTSLELRLPSKNVRRRSLGSQSASPFQSKAILRMEPHLGLMSCFNPATRWSMAPRHDPDGPHILVIRPSEGILIAKQGDIARTCHQREAIVVDLRETTTFIMTGVARLDCFSFRGFSTIPDPLIASGIQRINHDNGALIVLGHYAAALMRGLLPMDSSKLTTLAVDYMRNLVVAMLQSADASPVLDRRPFKTSANLVALKADIESRLAQRDLSIAGFANLQGITVRRIQKLFEAEGRTFSDYLLERRLERARHVLMSVEGSSLSISQVAYDLGFGDLSYFNRTFKKRFGITPREVRSQSRRLTEFRPHDS